MKRIDASVLRSWESWGQENRKLNSFVMELTPVVRRMAAVIVPAVQRPMFFQ